VFTLLPKRFMTSSKRQVVRMSTSGRSYSTIPSRVHGRLATELKRDSRIVKMSTGAGHRITPLPPVSK